VSDPAATRAEVAGKLRELGHEFVARDVDEATLAHMSEVIDQLIDEARRAPGRTRTLAASSYDAFASTVPQHGTGEPRQLFSDSIVSGGSNPMGLGAYLWRDGEQAVMEVTLGKAFEGAPERAHGGVVAALVDETMGLVLAIHHQMAYTVQLNIAYRAPTPVNTPLLSRAWLERREGRKLFMHARVSAGETTVVEAEAIFVAIESYHPPAS
jgi:acyl-coenzyme A thioesterase PaaI-like protein